MRHSPANPKIIRNVRETICVTLHIQGPHLRALNYFVYFVKVEEGKKITADVSLPNYLDGVSFYYIHCGGREICK